MANLRLPGLFDSRRARGGRSAWRRIAAFGALGAALLTGGPARAEDSAFRLEDAIQLALSRNERAQITDLNVVSAEAAVSKARAGFLPTLNINANDTQRPSAVERNGVVSQPANSATGTVVLTQPLVNVPAIPLYSQAKENLHAQQAQTVDDKRLLAFDASRAFLSVLASAAVLEAAKRRLSTANATLADTQARVQAQLTSSNDATRAKLDVATAERVVETNKGGVEAAVIQLGLLINAPVPVKLATPDATMKAAKQPLAKTDDLVKFATEHRPDLDSKQRLVSAARDGASEPLMRIFPSLNANAQFQLTSNPNGAGKYNDEFVGLSLSWTLYDAGVRYADKRSRDANAQIADLTARSLTRTIDAQVRVAVTNLTSARATYTAAEKEADVSRQNAEETAILYRQGLAKAIELVDANDSVFLAEVNFASADVALAQAYLDLRQALGLQPLGTDGPR